MEEKATGVFELDKATKNTMRFSELPEGPPIMNTVYVQKWVLNQWGNPEKIRVTIEPVRE